MKTTRRDDIEIVASSVGGGEHGLPVEEVYYLCGIEGRINEELFRSWSRCVDEYCAMTGEDPGTIDGPHRYDEDWIDD
jgi:hypothetical protein